MPADFAQEILKILDSRMMSNRKKIEELIKSHTDKTHLGRSFSELEVDRLLRDLESGDIMRMTQGSILRDLSHLTQRIETRVSDDLSKISYSSLKGLTLLRQRLSFIGYCLEDLVSDFEMTSEDPDSDLETFDKVNTLLSKVKSLTLLIYEKSIISDPEDNWERPELLSQLSEDLERERPSEDLISKRLIRETLSEEIDPEYDPDFFETLLTLTDLETQLRGQKSRHEILTHSLFSLVNETRVNILTDPEMTEVMIKSSDMRSSLKETVKRLRSLTSDLDQSIRDLEDLVSVFSQYDSLLSHLRMTRDDPEYRSDWYDFEDLESE